MSHLPRNVEPLPMTLILCRFGLIVESWVLCQACEYVPGRKMFTYSLVDCWRQQDGGRCIPKMGIYDFASPLQCNLKYVGSMMKRCQVWQIETAGTWSCRYRGLTFCCIFWISKGNSKTIQISPKSGMIRMHLNPVGDAGSCSSGQIFLHYILFVKEDKVKEEIWSQRGN